MVEERGEPLLPSLPCCPSFFALRLVVRVPAPGTRFPGPAPGACFAGSRSPRSQPFAPPTPLPAVWRCSSASLLLWPGLTSRARTSAATAPRLPAADHDRVASLARHETSRVPRKERPRMPGSPTTPGRRGAGDSAPLRVAFRVSDGVGTRNIVLFVAQWLACVLPCRRFVVTLAGANARLGAEVVSLRLPRGGLAPPTPCRSPGALR